MITPPWLHPREEESRWSACASSAASGPTGWTSTANGTPPCGRRCSDALRAAGWANYSLFLTDDGLLVGYLETDDYAAAQQRMAGTAVNERWQADMAPYFTDLGGSPPRPGFPEDRRDISPGLSPGPAGPARPGTGAPALGPRPARAPGS